MNGIVRAGRPPLPAIVAVIVLGAASSPALPASASTELEKIAQSIRFESAPSYPVGSVSASCLLYDLDGVRGPDLAASHDDSISILPNLGSGSFGAPVSFDMGIHVTAFAVGDLDGDGAADLVGAGELGTGEGRLSIRRGVGAMAFATPILQALPARSMCVVIGDMDGNGHPDVVVTAAGVDSLWVFPGDGSGGLSERRSYPVGSAYAGVQLADFNSDGALDVAALNAGGGDTVRVLLNLGAGRLGPATPVVTAGKVFAFTPADANGDGRLDLALVSGSDYASCRIEVAAGNGDGTFASSTTVSLLPASGSDLRSIRAADLDRDGRMDLVTSCYAGGHFNERNYCVVNRGHGDGTFEGRQQYRVSTRPIGVLVGDLDGDDAPDLVSLEEGHGFLQGGPSVTVLRNRSDGTFVGQTECVFIPGRGVPPWSSGAVEVVHLRAGGRPDLVVSDSHGTFVVLIESRDVSSAPLEVGPGWLEAFADLDGDALDDLVLASNDTTWTWRSLGDGQFALSGTYTGSTWLALTDLDGDGRRDLVGQAAGGVVVLRRGAPGGTFGEPVPVELQIRPEASTTTFGDLDGDGLADVACALATRTPDYGMGEGPDTLIVQYNLGDGSFTLPAGYALPRMSQHCCFRPNNVVIADVNGDGRRDILVLSGSSLGSDNYASVAIMVNAGDRSLADMPPFLAGNSALDLHVADLNRDGLGDILTVNSSGGWTFHFLFHENVGGGSFLPAEYDRVADYSSAIGVGDIDGDGLPDVVTYSARWGGSLVVTRNCSIPTLPTEALLSLVSSSADPGRVVLAWSGSVDGIGQAHVDRRAEGESWTTLATLLPDGRGEYRFEDAAVAAGARYAYRLGFAYGGGEAFSHEAWIDVPQRAALALSGARPNPAAGSPTIAFSVPGPGVTTLEVLDVAGRRMRDLRWESLAPGEHRVRLGGTFRPGVYLLRLVHGGSQRSARMVVVR